MVKLTAYGCEQTAIGAFDIAEHACRRYERLFSRTVPEGDIGRLNAAKGQPVAVSEETHRLLRASLERCASSRGLFDITVGSVTRLWDFRAGVIPSHGDIAEALRHVDYRTVKLGESDGVFFAQLADSMACVDLGGIAKGYIADELVGIMLGQGVESFVIDLGGSISTRGRKPEGGRFAFGIPDPRDRRFKLATVAAENASLVSSGVYERSFCRDGKRYHHIIDPSTGWPVETDIQAVTVIARDALAAEGVSTTLCALGIEEAADAVRTLDDVEGAVFINDDFNVLCVGRIFGS